MAVVHRGRRPRCERRRLARLGEQGEQLRRHRRRRQLHDVLPRVLHGDRRGRLPRVRKAGEDKLRHPGEYYALIILSTIGAIGMAASRELMTAYLSLELLSFSLYILVVVPEVRPALERGGSEVPAARRVRVGDVPVRDEPHLRRNRDARTTAISPRISSQGTHDFQLGAADGPRADHHGPRLQGRRRPVPHVDAGRLRGRARRDHRLPVDDVEGGGVRAAAPAVQRRVPGCARRLELDDRGHCRGDDDPRQPRGAATAQHQAADGVLVDRPDRLHAHGHRGALARHRLARSCCT